MKRTIRGLLCLAALFAAASAGAQSYRYYVTEMQAPGPYTGSVAYAVNRDGSVVGMAEAGSATQAYVWKPTTPNSITGAQLLLGQLAGGATSVAGGISDNGMIAGYAVDGLGQRNLTSWDPVTGIPTRLVTVTSSFGNTLGINNAGQITYMHDGAPWVYQNGTSALLACSWGGAYAINQAGDVVGSGNNGIFSSYQGMFWNAGSYAIGNNLGVLFGPAFREPGILSAINSSRRTTGYASVNGVPQAIVWDMGTITPLFIGPNALQSSGYGINEQGDVVGAYTNNGQSGRPFLFQNGTFHDLQSEIDPSNGWFLLEAYDINEYGQICGFGYLNGLPRGYLLTPVDTIPPIFTSLTADNGCLWPPNHKMVAIKLTATATDNSGGPLIVQIVNVTSSEPSNGLGDGDTDDPDWIITGPMTLKLRSERSGTGPGRTYTITVKCTDAIGNSAYKTVTVGVPHDQGKK